MPVYSYAQLESLWINAGGAKALAPVAAAIAEAESGGNSDALNPNDNNGTQSSFGLWQISNGTHAPPSPNWANPAVNAQLAVAKYKAAGGWSPWGTYTSGAYKGYLSGKTVPDPNVPGSATALAAEAAAAGSADCLIGFGGIPGTSWINDIFGSGGNIGQVCFLSKSSARGQIGVALMIAGALIMLPGLVMVVMGIPQVQAAAGMINRIPVAGQVTRKTVARGQAATQKAPWYQRANNPENLNPLNTG